MKKILKEEIDLPFVEGQIYTTRFATGEKFTVTKITTKDGIQTQVFGIYYNSPNLGACRLEITRLIPLTQLTGREFEYHVCPHCKKTYE